MLFIVVLCVYCISHYIISIAVVCFCNWIVIDP